MIKLFVTGLLIILVSFFLDIKGMLPEYPLIKEKAWRCFDGI
jgi:hypothetical protein